MMESQQSLMEESESRLAMLVNLQSDVVSCVATLKVTDSDPDMRHAATCQWANSTYCTVNTVAAGLEGWEGSLCISNDIHTNCFNRVWSWKQNSF